jgi:hypothetical protein
VVWKENFEASGEGEVDNAIVGKGLTTDSFVMGEIPASGVWHCDWMPAVSKDAVVWVEQKGHNSTWIVVRPLPEAPGQ